MKIVGKTNQSNFPLAIFSGFIVDLSIYTYITVCIFQATRGSH